MRCGRPASIPASSPTLSDASGCDRRRRLEVRRGTQQLHRRAVAVERADVDVRLAGTHPDGLAVMLRDPVGDERADVLVGLRPRLPETMELVEDGARHL